MPATRRTLTPGALTLAGVSLLVLAAPSSAATVTSFSLSPKAAYWHEHVEAHIAGVGCSGAAATPAVTEVRGTGATWLVDIDMLECGGPNAAHSFSTVVTLPRLLPHVYAVRVQDAIRHIVSPPPPPLATLLLGVHDMANLTVEVPETATTAAPTKIVVSGIATSSCFLLDPPALDDVLGSGHIITIDYDDNCPILPIPGPDPFREEMQIGPLAAGDYEIRLLDFSHVTSQDATPALVRLPLTVYAANACVPTATTLCLGNRRFAVTVTWEDFLHRTGVGHALPIDGGDGATGLIWFFGADNVELTIKLLDACQIYGKYWAFLSSGSTVAYVVTVTDTVTGVTRTYHNASGEAAPLRTDVGSFPCSR